MLDNKIKLYSNETNSIDCVILQGSHSIKKTRN